MFLGGGSHLLLMQLAGIALTIVIAVVGTLVIAKILSLFMPLRVNKEDERRGLDETQHGEKAYPAFTGMD